MKRIVDIKELREIQLGILRHVDVFCRQHNIRYFMSGGSMIGAVRHNGFIPWDDDIDIMMLREDYEHFISLYTKENTSEYRLHHYSYNKSYTFPFVKIDNSKTVLVERVNYVVDDLGVNIDLFPIDVVPNEKVKQYLMYNKAWLLLKIFDLKNIAPSPNRIWCKNAMLRLFHFLFKPIGMEGLVHRLNRIAIKYNAYETLYCGVVVWGYGMKEINFRENWNNVLEIHFEDMIVPIPEGYDNYLSCLYGNYMELPPEEKRLSSHYFNAWWK